MKTLSQLTKKADKASDAFKDLVIPEGPIKLDEVTTIIDVPKFIKSHGAIVDAHKNNPYFKHYRRRLLKLYYILNPK